MDLYPSSWLEVLEASGEVAAPVMYTHNKHPRVDQIEGAGTVEVPILFGVLGAKASMLRNRPRRFYWRDVRAKDVAIGMLSRKIQSPDARACANIENRGRVFDDG